MRSFGQGGGGELTSRTAGLKQLYTILHPTIVILKGESCTGVQYNQKENEFAYDGCLIMGDDKGE